MFPVGMESTCWKVFAAIAKSGCLAIIGRKDETADDINTMRNDVPLSEWWRHRGHDENEFEVCVAVLYA